MEEQSSVNILNNLLRKIFGYLPLNDQLNMRKVNKNWEAEAGYVLRENPWLKINVGDKNCLNDFLIDYYAPPCGPNGLLPLAKVFIKPSTIRDRRLDLFGQQHAEYIRNLTIQLENVHIRHFESKSRYLLQYFTNLEKLRLDIDIEECHFGESNSETLPSAPLLPNLRHFEMACPVSHVELPYSIILNAPAPESVSLDMRDARTVHPLTNEFLTKLKDLRMISLDLTLSLSDHDHDLDPDLGNPNSLIGKLMQSELKPEQLIIYLEPLDNRQVFWVQNGDEPTEIAKNLLNNLIAKFCRTGLEKLLIRSYYRNDVQILLPVEATRLKYLNFGLEENLNYPKNVFKQTYFSQNHAKTVQAVSPLTSVQLPNLGTLLTEATRDDLFHQNNVFLNMNKLMMYGYPPPTTSVTWPAQFPNLTILDICVQAGHEEFLDPILTQMLNLVELSIYYGYGSSGFIDVSLLSMGNNHSPDAIWDKITGGLRPILSKNSPLESIIPPGWVRDTAEEGTAQTQPGTVPALQNLRKLKILKLGGMPSCIAAAIVHLTAIQKIPSLDILKLDVEGETASAPVYYQRFVPAQEWINVLERYHGHVEMT